MSIDLVGFGYGEGIQSGIRNLEGGAMAHASSGASALAMRSANNADLEIVDAVVIEPEERPAPNPGAGGKHLASTGPTPATLLTPRPR